MSQRTEDKRARQELNKMLSKLIKETKNNISVMKHQRPECEDLTFNYRTYY